MKSPAPPRVVNIDVYWTNPPPEPSQRCIWWEHRIKDGWRRNKRIGKMGYHESAAYFGVYIWEWLNVLAPLLDKNKCICHETVVGKAVCPIHGPHPAMVAGSADA